jgi:hypothetical protein
MSPKDKATEIIEAMRHDLYECATNKNAKRCALRCVDEIIQAVDDTYTCYIPGVVNSADSGMYRYWCLVREEIESRY